MKLMNKNKQAEQKHHISGVIYRPLFPRPICLERCTMNMPNGYEKDILMTLKSFSNETAYHRKSPHKLSGKDNLYSIDVKSRDDKYRMFFYIDDNNICKITNLCSTDTH
jgi:hypothetical protein